MMQYVKIGDTNASIILEKLNNLHVFITKKIKAFLEKVMLHS